LTKYNTPTVVPFPGTKPNIRTLAARRNPSVLHGCTRLKARTVPHYPLPLAIDDVGIAGCTTTCLSHDRHSRPLPYRAGA